MSKGYNYPSFPSRRLWDEPDEVCGRCEFHRKNGVADDWHCVNAASPYFEEFTEYGDNCGEFSSRGSHNSAQDDFND